MSNETDAITLRKLALSVHMETDAQRQALERVAAQLESDAKRYADSEKLQDIGRGCYESIADMVAALECDYDRLSELRNERESFVDDADDKGVARTVYDATDEGQELAELEKAAGDCESCEDAERRISEDPLSIELTGTWTRGETPTADRALILLGTGGPATRIVCELGNGGEPTRAWVQAQDWFTPWTDYVGGDGETLLTYCRCFYFGDFGEG